MVLVRACLVAALVLGAGGCKQSLFDNHGGGDDTPGDAKGSGDGSVQTACGAMCLADAGKDFDGTTGGTGNRWRYLDDHRNRTWTPMSPAGAGVVTGVTPSVQITSCQFKSTAAACAQLPGALLVSTSAPSSPADPAISYTATAKAVIQLSLRVVLTDAAGTAQKVRLYRNSREDVLYASTIAPQQMAEQSLTVDALAGDRFYFEIEGTQTGSADVGVQLFVNGTTESFPKACQLAATFDSPAGAGVDNACGVALKSWDESSGTATNTAPQLGAAPFPELGMSATIALDHWYETSDVMNRAGDTTLQMWVKHVAFGANGASWFYSDSDLNNGGGMAIYVYDDSGATKAEFNCCALSTPPYTSLYLDVDYPADHAWHFLRMVHTNGTVRVCIDGNRVGSFPAAAGADKTTIVPYIGRNAYWTPQGAYFDGSIDDVRIFSGALPCE